MQMQSLLLNIPPDKHGRIAKADCEQLKQLGEMLKNKFAHNIAATAQIEADTVQTDHSVEFLTDGDNGTYWLASEGQCECSHHTSFSGA